MNVQQDQGASEHLAALVMTMWPIWAQIKAVARLYLNVGSPPAEGTLGLVGCSVVQGIGLHGGWIPRRWTEIQSSNRGRWTMFQLGTP